MGTHSSALRQAHCTSYAQHACLPLGGVQVSDNDDDGESSSGTKLAALLELANVNNVLVVVSRWFGGVLLGPVRFKYIASTARALLEETGRCTSGPLERRGWRQRER